MSLTFKFDKLFFNIPSEEELQDNTEKENDIELYNDKANARNLLFVNADGKQTTLYYSNLLKVEFLSEENSITLYFTSDTVALKGHNLDKINEPLSKHQLKRIKCIDKRYSATKDEDKIYISEMSFK